MHSGLRVSHGFGAKEKSQLSDNSLWWNKILNRPRNKAAWDKLLKSLNVYTVCIGVLKGLKGAEKAECIIWASTAGQPKYPTRDDWEHKFLALMMMGNHI